MATAALLLAMLPGHAGEIPPDARRSGTSFMAPETRAIQDDDTANPGLLWVQEGDELWRKKVGASGQSCADCHGEARDSMAGIAARYPAFDRESGKPVNLEQRINLERERHQQAAPLPSESRELLALEAVVARQSRGLPITPAADPQLVPFVARGRELFTRRQGQLNLSCAQCHDSYSGKRLAGNVIPQGHPNGYPLYRLEWQGVGSLERRLRNCLAGTRAQTYAYGAPELVDLELYLMWRARGLKMETPAVRP